MKESFREHVAYLLKPYLREENNADYLALKIEQICDASIAEILHNKMKEED